MKKLKSIVAMSLLVLGLLAVSCQKDEDLIVGKWKLIELTGDNVEGNRDLVGSVGSIYEFTSDKKLKLSVNGSSFSANYSISDDKLTITFLARTIQADVEKLTKKELHLLYNSEYGQTGASLEKQ